MRPKPIGTRMRNNAGDLGLWAVVDSRDISVLVTAELTGPLGF